MRTGLAEVEKTLKSSGNNSGGGLGRYLSRLILEDGESKTFRFLTDVDDLGSIPFYEFVSDKNGKPQDFVVAPMLHADDPDWVGEDWVLKFGGKTRKYKSEEMEDPRARNKVVGIAVEREEYVVEEKGRRVTRTRDKIFKVPSKDGDKEYEARNFMVIKQDKKFWDTIIGYYHEVGTICDRDFKVTRKGKHSDISILAKTPDPDWDHDGSSLEDLRNLYGYGTGKNVDGVELTQDSEDRFLYCRETLREWVENQASEERARFALVPDGMAAETRPAPGWATGDDDEPTASVASGPAAATTENLRARLEQHQRSK